MKFFTREWHNGSLTDAEVEATRTAYWRHVADLASRMPTAVKALAQSVNLHDGRLRAILFDRRQESLTISMRGGDLSGGYFDVKIVYHSVVLSDSNRLALRAVSRNAEAEVLYDEIDDTGSRWLHRILFWPYEEIEVEFTELSLQVKPRSDREFARPADVYEELPERAG